MSDDSYLDQLVKRLQSVDQKIAEARRQLATWEPGEDVSAAAELAQLEVKRDGLREKIDAAAKNGADDWSAFRTTLAQDLDALTGQIHGWFSGHELDEPVEEPGGAP